MSDVKPPYMMRSNDLYKRRIKLLTFQNYYANKNMFKKLTFPHDWGRNGEKKLMTRVDANL